MLPFDRSIIAAAKSFVERESSGESVCGPETCRVKRGPRRRKTLVGLSSRPNPNGFCWMSAGVVWTSLRLAVGVSRSLWLVSVKTGAAFHVD